jgi:hypothetical protein
VSRQATKVVRLEPTVHEALARRTRALMARLDRDVTLGAVIAAALDATPDRELEARLRRT